MTDALKGTKLFIFSDSHFGVNYSHHRDPVTGVSERSLDGIAHFVKVVRAARAENALAVICAGDFYTKSHGVNPTIRRYLRDGFPGKFPGPLALLQESGIPLHIVAGNHDAPASTKKGCDLEELTAYPNIHLFRRSGHQIFKIGNSTTALVYLPYYKAQQFVDQYRRKRPDAVINPDQHDEIVSRGISSLVERQLKMEPVQNADIRVIVGHYVLSEAETGRGSRYQVLPNDIKLRRDEFKADEFDLAVFGHIHKQQDLSHLLEDGHHLIVPGSLDRLDWGEAFDGPKGYWTYDVLTKQLEFHEIACRQMVAKTIEVPQKESQVDTFVMDRLPMVKNPEGAEVRVTVHVPKGKSGLLSSIDLNAKYLGAFQTWFLVQEFTTAATEFAPREHILEPQLLFEDFINEFYEDERLRGDLLREGSFLFEEEGASTVDKPADEVWIQRVEVSNFNKYREKQSITLDRPTTAIVGPTGSGKTSLFDAITYAIYGPKALRVKNATDAFAAEGGYVRVEFRQGKTLWSVKRGYTASKTRTLSSYLNVKYKDDGATRWEPLEGGIKKKEDHLEIVFGMDLKGFQNSVFIPQGEIKNFSRSSSESIKVLQKLFHLGVFDTLQKAASTRLKESQAILEQTNGRIHELEKNVHKKGAVEDEIHDLKEKFGQFQDQESEIKEKITAVTQERNELQPLRDELVEKQVLLETMSKQARELSTEIKGLEKSATEYQQKTTVMEKFDQEKMERFDDMRVKETELKAQVTLKRQVVSQHQDLQSQKQALGNKYKRRLNDIAGRIKVLKQRISTIPTTVDKDEAFELLRNEGRLKGLIDRIASFELDLADRFEQADLRGTLETEVDELKSVYREVTEKTEMITPECFTLSELKAQLRELEIDLANVQRERDSEVTNLDFQIEKVSEELAGFDNSLEDDLSQLSSEISSLERDVKEFRALERYFRDHNDPRPEIQAKQEKLAKLSQQQANIDADITRLTDQTANYEHIEAKLRKLNTDLNSMTDKRAAKQQRLKDLEDTLKDIIEAKETLDILKEGQAERNRLVTAFRVLKEEVFHGKGITQYAINKMTGPISTNASEYLAQLSNGRYEQVVLEAVESGRSYGFQITVFDPEIQDGNGKWRPVETFSGGEQTQINAALRFAISKIVSRLSFHGLKFLIIDEGDLGSLDEEDARRDFVTVMQQLGEEYKQMILITHFPGVAEAFDRTFEVVMTPEGSMIRQRA